MSAPTSSDQGLLARISAPSGEGREIVDAATREPIAWAPEGSAADVDAAIERARAAQPAWEARGEQERCDLLLKAADAIEAHAEELAVLLSREQGKPLNGPNARFEVGACATWLRESATTPLEPKQLIDDDSGRAVLRYRAAGVVGAISPWNWPLMISTWQFAPSLRMGNTVVLKPSEYTPLSVLALIAVINDVLPPDVLIAVPGAGEVGAALSGHEGVDKVMFTGSTATGRRIIEASSANLARLTLELGGNDAGIVLPDVDPAEIAKGLFWGAFINTGQTCAALKRLYVHEDVYDDVVAALAEVVASMPIGNGLDENNVLGPLQNKAQFDIVARLVADALDQGGRAVVGGAPAPELGELFFAPTVIADVDDGVDLVDEEQFGPALPVIRYRDVDDAVARANRLPAGLGASVWSSDRDAALAIAERLEAGTVWINGHGGLHPKVPFGGVKGSGYGLEFGVEGLKAVAVPQVISG